jgi:KaiC/GvpD/RAD55 family RecA-like ATPase
MSPDDLAAAFAEAMAQPATSGNGDSPAFDAIATARIIAEATKRMPRLAPADLRMGLDDWASRLGGQPAEDIAHSIVETIDLIRPVCDDPSGEVKAALLRAGLLPEECEEPESPFIDWASFWSRERSDVEWTYDDVLARGRGHAVYAGHKTGKSLLMLWIAAQVVQRPDHACLYLDYEMSESDLFDRLDDMGFGKDTDFSRLRYALLPSLPPLDTSEGADAVMALAELAMEGLGDVHLTVVMDTASRAVRGEEDKADTWRAFYNQTGIRLKRAGFTWVRLDHAGKDATRGQRGSSSKGDDVDVIWKLARTENGLELKREAARMSWVPERVLFKRSDDPLRYVRIVQDWPEGTQEVALHLDRLGVPITDKVSDAQTALKEHGVARRRALVNAAMRWRRQRNQRNET